MRRLSTLVAALATVFTVGSANALVVLIDDFNSPDLEVIDQAGGGATVSLPTNPNGRYVSHELLSGTNTLGGIGSSVTIGSSSIPTGSLNVNNSTGRDSEVKVGWTLANGLILDNTFGPASFLFDVITSDANATSAALYFNNVLIGSYSIPGNTSNLPLSFAVSAATQIWSWCSTAPTNGICRWTPSASPSPSRPPSLWLAWPFWVPAWPRAVAKPDRELKPDRKVRVQ
jgi:hypothetical protein